MTPLPPHSKEKGFTPEDEQGEGMSEIAAFPCAQSPQTFQNQEGAPFQAGMSLRDYFAAQIISSVDWADYDISAFDDETLLKMCQQTYRVADAMLKARG